MTGNNKAKAYVDGFYYMESEQHCSICGELTNRVNAETGDRQCADCDDLVVKNYVEIDGNDDIQTVRFPDWNDMDDVIDILCKNDRK